MILWDANHLELRVGTSSIADDLGDRRGRYGLDQIISGVFDDNSKQKRMLASELV